MRIKVNSVDDKSTTKPKIPQPKNEDIRITHLLLKRRAQVAPKKKKKNTYYSEKGCKNAVSKCVVFNFIYDSELKNKNPEIR